MLTECPHCGSRDGYRYKDYGAILVYIGLFGQGQESEECVEIEGTRPNAVFATCIDCGKRVRLAAVRGED